MKFDFKKAMRIQRKLAKEVRFKPVKNVRFVAGCDLTYVNPFKTPTLGIGAFVVLSYPDLKVVEKVYDTLEVRIPYVTTFLAFREVPLLLKTFRKLHHRIDLVVVDGHGIVHPRGLGVAAHFGVLMKIPSIGCAKSPLYGRFKEPCLKRGCYEPILKPKTAQVMGYAVRTRDNVKPVYVSPGNLVTLNDTLDFTLSLSRGYRIPEPTRLAHNFLQQVRKVYNPSKLSRGG
jgi:deoxyribonuclease V